jgi:hypothetical protein
LGVIRQDAADTLSSVDLLTERTNPDVELPDGLLALLRLPSLC